MATSGKSPWIAWTVLFWSTNAHLVIRSFVLIGTHTGLLLTSAVQWSAADDDDPSRPLPPRQPTYLRLDPSLDRRFFRGSAHSAIVDRPRHSPP